MPLKQNASATFLKLGGQTAILNPSTTEDQDMGKKRLQQKGDLRRMAGWWRIRWREDQIQGDGSAKYGWSQFRDVGPCLGENKMTRKEAERASWDNYLSRLDQNMRTPQSILTVAQFVERRFVPEHVMVALKPAGVVHYRQALPHVLDGIPEKRRSFKGIKKGQELPEIPRHFGIGKKRMRDVTHEDIQRLVSTALQRGYSVQTAKHIKNCVSAIFTFAEEINWFSGRNPAKFVRLPEMTRRPVRVLSFEELKALLSILKPAARAMVLCASLTSMNVAEICGLRWKRVNLTSEPVIMDGESLPPHSIAVREQWRSGAYGTVKAAARRRNLPLPKLLVEALQGVKILATVNISAAVSGELPVFPGRNGPLDQGAMLKRQVRPAGATIGAPGLGWHDLRRTFATLADQLGMTPGERQALMGHSRASQTMAYTHTPSDQALAALERLGEKVGTVQ